MGLTAYCYRLFSEAEPSGLQAREREAFNPSSPSWATWEWSNSKQVRVQGRSTWLMSFPRGWKSTLVINIWTGWIIYLGILCIFYELTATVWLPMLEALRDRSRQHSPCLQGVNSCLIMKEWHSFEEWFVESMLWIGTTPFAHTFVS